MKRFIIFIVFLLFASVPLLSAELIYFNDFENPSDPLNEWSYIGSVCPDDPIRITPGTSQHPADRYLGQFTGNESTILTLNNLPPHTKLTISFDLYIIRTWDGIEYMGHDIWDLSVDGTQTLLHTTFNNFWYDWSPTYYRQSYPDTYPGGNNPDHTGAWEIDTLGFRVTDYDNRIMDSVYHFYGEHSFTLSHSTDSIQFIFSGIGPFLSSTEDTGAEIPALIRGICAATRNSL